VGIQVKFEMGQLEVKVKVILRFSTTDIVTTVIGHNCYRHNYYRYTIDIGIQLLSGTTVIGTTVMAINLILQYNCYWPQVVLAPYLILNTSF